MTKSTHTIEYVREQMQNLINRATSYDVSALETIYHDDLHIMILDLDNNVKTSNKREFINYFSSLAAEGREPMNTWCDWHHIHIHGDEAVVVLSHDVAGDNTKIHIHGDEAVVVLSRKNDVAGDNTKIKCSIDWLFEDGRWQIIREEIFQVANN